MDRDITHSTASSKSGNIPLSDIKAGFSGCCAGRAGRGGSGVLLVSVSFTGGMVDGGGEDVCDGGCGASATDALPTPTFDSTAVSAGASGCAGDGCASCCASGLFAAGWAGVSGLSMPVIGIVQVDDVKS